MIKITYATYAGEIRSTICTAAEEYGRLMWLERNRYEWLRSETV